MNNLERPQNSNTDPALAEIDFDKIMSEAAAPSPEDLIKARAARLAVEESLGSPKIEREFGSWGNKEAEISKKDAQEARAARLAQDKKSADEILSSIQKKAA